MLLAEDEAIVAMGLVDIVEEEGADVIGPFARKEDCLASLDRQIPDIAILDLRLEDGDFLEVAEKLTAVGVPIIFHSGHMIDEEWGRRETTVLYCGKPCAEAEMKRALLEAAKS